MHTPCEHFFFPASSVHIPERKILILVKGRSLARGRNYCVRSRVPAPLAWSGLNTPNSTRLYLSTGFVTNPDGPKTLYCLIDPT